MENTLKSIIENLKQVIEFPSQMNEVFSDTWYNSSLDNLDIKCWDQKSCDKKGCPAYFNKNRRCWLIAGTMCGNCQDGLDESFAQKFNKCYYCDVFQTAVFQDPATNLKEMLIIIMHNLHMKQLQLGKAREELNNLKNLIPICAHCRKIRNDDGYWQKIESYVHQHFDAEFSHGICPNCARELYPEINLNE